MAFMMTNNTSDDKAISESAPAPRLLDQARDRLRLKHYSIRTEQAYVDWIKRYIRFLDKRHLQPTVPFAPPARPGSTQRKGCLEERLVGV